ncbi:fumarylacetoacetate hydrolase domain-containing protein 2-like [Diorhabda carinulata]|uniref:fumarylacetoacetate hydrolase domain-containing protein 2-like n=1 Tax=Diorhabda carinulata TaxID=1163345 RepID=UPI0025A1EAED|nr:fumarylacetoacetate hydrolase domain-containing protein 2-like [Diorhabda carinulata]
MNFCRNFNRRVGNNLINMRIVQFKLEDEKTRIGIVNGNNVIDVNANDSTIPNSLVDFLNQSEDVLGKLKNVAANPKLQYDLSKVKILSPITRPDKILGVASNYKDDCQMRNIPFPKELTVFNKFGSVIIGPNDPIPKSQATNALDWEVELVAVIGKKAKNVKAKDSMDYVFGYTMTQDLTAKDWVMRSNGQLLMCKNFEGFSPLGPWVITKEELGDPYDVKLKTWVNGQLKQDGHSSNMIHKIDAIIEYFSSVMTLLPGDIILTGTPFGVGASQIPPQYLQKGDLLETEIDKIGKMFHRIV